MGVFLDKPKTEKTTLKGEGKGLKYGVAAMQGWRMDMEDAHVCETNFKWKDWSFFGVFDGHAGVRVSQICSKRLLSCIVESTKFEGEGEALLENVKKGIKAGFLKLDEELKKLLLQLNEDLKSQPSSDSKEDRSGSTAVAAFVSPTHIIWANCGDSRGLLSEKEALRYATTDHKPFNEAEKERIEKAGGTVMMQRVNGTLAVSRALGDFDYKRVDGIKPECQLVSPEPEVHCMERRDTDEFMLLACDGVFDVMKNEDVIEYVSYRLGLTDDLEKVCCDLIDKCLNKNSRDNMSAILVTFPAAPKVTEEAIQKDKEMQEQVDKKLSEMLQKLKEEAKEPLDLDEHTVLKDLEDILPPNYDFTNKKPGFIEQLERLRKEKFGDIDNSFEDQIQGGITGPDSPNLKMFEAVGIPDSKTDDDTSGQENMDQLQ